ncbi:MAG: DEAD/DEAH box helicase [Pseudomonadales bacterium]|nr:DEAD/DEAH box helicase [Pseudomonadales bacterium]MDP4764847.1 DEAD/DEAH box helicase [Pseudomonadales bacterium]MDP5058135.1 DEAD/DEAH box helicase [Pseudomonadales bacterium]
MPDTTPLVTSFRDLNLPAPILKALDEVGYETPSPIQSKTIPLLLAGHDVLGNAPTGTGKTAAFGLPLLSRVDVQNNQVQMMVLTPTRELAIQVAEALQRYASHMQGFHVLPIYGGQDYSGQIRQLKRGVHVIVGTPGRVMDHIRKGTLNLSGLRALVLDEADEMLRMGFLDDVEWILEQLPKDRQMALFSATMPKEVKRISQKYLREPQVVEIKSLTATAETISQRYWLVSNAHKLDALTRILEVETFDAMLIFVRTKTATTELAQRLEARGYSAAALNGDMVQKQREEMIKRLKNGTLDILVATDVAARGLDVDRIGHVVNYDIPYDTEAYIHRIGRTGRAGREGQAILFVAPRETRMLSAIERATRQKITQLELPSTEMVNNKRIAGFKQSITDVLGAGRLDFLQNIVEQYQREHDIPALEIAAALAKMALGDRDLLITDKPTHTRPDSDDQPDSRARPPRDANSRGADSRSADSRPARTTEARPRRARDAKPPEGLERYRIEVGHQHEVKPGNIVGAIANEAGLDAVHIGHIDIHDDFSYVDLPAGMPSDIFHDLKKVRVCGHAMKITRASEEPAAAAGNKPDRVERSKPAVKPSPAAPAKVARSKPATVTTAAAPATAEPATAEPAAAEPAAAAAPGDGLARVKRSSEAAAEAEAMAATPIKPVKRTVAAAAEKKPAKITIKETVNKAVKAAPKKTAAAKPKKVAGKGE